MKTKHLFYSLALASAFAACTQEELIETPAVKDNVAGRPVAGVVEFKFDEGVESRYNYELKKGFENGDVFGLYLMDNFKENGTGCPGEHLDANTTYWKYQNHWWGMYELTNSIQSNYPFRATVDGDDVIWKNDAKLVEGNYFAMFPQNNKALNRRELWHSIEPQVTLKPHTSKENVFQYVENQFWLGYQQIYRDATASAEGEMKMNVKMTGVLVPLRIEMTGFANNDVILDKISFRSKDGKPLPTLAYVEPNGKDFKVYQTDDKSELVCNDYKAIGLYDAAKTWTKANVQNLVRWSYPGENGIYPYGLEGTDATPVYEYSFAYPEDTQVDALVRNGDVVNTYIAIPALDTAEEWNNIQVCIYGWRVTNGSQGPIYGMLTPNTSNSNAAISNYTFELKDVIGWNQEQAEETLYYRPVYVEFSDFSWQPINQTILTSSTEDMEKMVMSYLAKTVNDVEFTISPDVNGVEIKEEFLKDLKKISANNGRTITLNFIGGREGAKVIFNDDETMAIDGTTTESSDNTNDRVKFTYSNGIDLINNATQTVKYYTLGNGATVKNYGTLDVAVDGSIYTVENNNIMTVSHGGQVENLDNWAELTLKCSSNVKGINNQSGAVTNVDAAHANCYQTAYVGTFKNERGEDGCTACAPATLNIVSGTLQVTNLDNNAVINNASTIAVEELNNNSHKHDGAELNVINNNGTIQGIKNITAIIKNYAIVNNGNAEGASGNMYGTVENASVINAFNATKIQTLVNVGGTLYVKSVDVDVIPASNSNGTIVFEGVVNQHITTGSADKRVFRTIEAMDMSDLADMMDDTKTTYLWTAYNITFDGTSGKDVITYDFINEVVVEGSEVLFTAQKGDTFIFTKNPGTPQAAMSKLVIKKNCLLNVEDGIILKFDEIEEGEGDIHVGTSSSLQEYKFTKGHWNSWKKEYVDFAGDYQHNN